MRITRSLSALLVGGALVGCAGQPSTSAPSAEAVGEAAALPVTLGEALAPLCDSLCGGQPAVADEYGVGEASSALPRRTPAEVALLVNDTWQSNHPAEGSSAFWHSAVYHVGNVLTAEAARRGAGGCSELAAKGEAGSYMMYTWSWAQHNKWTGATEPDPDKWEYKTYGEDQRHVLFADWQCCFLPYLLEWEYVASGAYDMELSDEELAAYGARARAVMRELVERPDVDYWWWVDALFMAMPTLAELTALDGDDGYIRKALACLAWTEEQLLDRGQGLFYRDAKYVYPTHATRSGKKDFWARGNGWAAAALALSLDRLPDGHSARPALEARLASLATALRLCQQPEGHWTRSLLDPEEAPGYETSGTALICYALAWGINHGVLDRQEFLPSVARAWHYLSTVALQHDGRVGYVQPIGEAPAPGVSVNARSEADFGTGAFLLAASQLY